MRVVVKIGTSSITDDLGVIDVPVIEQLCTQIAALRAAGHEVLLVSSGAVSAGVSALGLDARPRDLGTLQAISAAGQSRLMEVYNRALGTHGLVAAQVLLVVNDFVERRQYLRVRTILHRLLALGCVPVVNENDALAGDELRFGDNDRIAALLSHNVAADLLVLLTDQEGLFTADPRGDSTAALIDEVDADDPLLAVRTSGRGTARGSGGMASKLTAARLASWSGVTTVIAAAQRPRAVLDAVAGKRVGTTFRAHRQRIPARKLWIGFAAQARGTVTIDDGACRALGTGRSLLAAGVTAVSGPFAEGDVVEVRDLAGQPVARGLVLVAAATLAAVAGKRSSELPEGIAPEVIHRDDLVVTVRCPAGHLGPGSNCPNTGQFEPGTR